MRYKSKKSQNIRSFFVIVFGLFTLVLTIVLFRQNFSLTEMFAGVFAGNGHTIYVSNIGGSDSNTGLTGKPVKTISKGLELAQPGDTVLVEPGVYSEHINLSGKNGTKDAPIRVVGASTDPQSYPVIDGGDPNYTASTNNPSIKLNNSSWITIERLKFQNATYDTIVLTNSHYITIRRNKIDYHSHAILSSNNTSHVLVEYNDIYQNYPAGSKWSDLKSSKWEGGAFVSFTGAGMNVIRYNYFHDQFNSVYMHRGTSTKQYLGANTWIYRNKFENIIDDAFEPETFAFNNHLFENTFINSHRMLSVAPNGLGKLLGPIYVYNNMQITRIDPTKEASKGRVNSAYKVELDGDHFSNGVYVFNNSVDLNYPGTNNYAIDFLNSSPTNFYHYNHAYTTPKTAFNKTPTMVNSDFNSDMSLANLGYTEKNGYATTNPGFSNPAGEDLRPTSTSALRGKSQAVVVPLGFSQNSIIRAGSDLGAYQYGEDDFRQVPSPIYVAPPGGEPSSFPSNYPWPVDIYGGSNPPSGPAWSKFGNTTFTEPSLPIASTTTVTPTPTPLTSPISKPNPSIVPTPTPTSPTANQVSLVPSADAHVRAKDPKDNNATSTTMTADFNPDKIIYLKFNTSSIKGKTIDSAILSVRLSGSTSTSVKQNIKLVSDQSWTENGLNYENRPSLGQIVGSFSGGNDKQTISSSISIANITTDSVTLAIDTSSKTDLTISSRETGNPPLLVIKYH